MKSPRSLLAAGVLGGGTLFLPLIGYALWTVEQFGFGRLPWSAYAGVVFALSMDDFVITQYLAAGPDTNTVSMLLYATSRAAPTPALNALATISLAITLVTLGIAYLVYRKFAGAGAASAVGTLEG